MAESTRFSINKFKSTIDAAGGLSRGVFYDCVITVNPPSTTNGATFTSGAVSFGEEQLLLCKAANLPTAQLDFTDLKYFTRSVKIPAARQFQPVTLTFYNTQNYQLRNKFLEWLSRFNQPVTNQRDDNTNIGFYGIIELRPKDMAHNNVAKYQFQNAFPTSITGLQYSYENDTQVQTYDVEFQYLTATFSVGE